MVFSMNEPFTGIYAASATPLMADLSCDYDMMAQHCKKLIEEGCNGVVLFGTTGEGPSFSLAERQKAVQALIERGLDPQKTIVSVGGSSIEETVALTKTALSLQCSTVLMMPPYFFKKVSDEGISAFYREVIQRVNDPNLKIPLYHIPQFSGVPITLELIENLREEFPDTVIGIKESEGNWNLTQAILKRFPGFKVFVGNEQHIAAAVSHGASGGISGVANIAPKLICALYENGKDEKKPNRDTEIEVLLALIKKHFFIPAVKSILENQAPQWRSVRPPLVALTDEQAQELQEGFQALVKARAASTID
jgi:4-hydroxy-tetrahydrodipicolinate synthase